MIKDPYQSQFDYNRKLCKHLYRISDITDYKLQDNFWNFFKESYAIDEIREFIQPDRTVKDSKIGITEHNTAMSFFND